MTVDVWSQPMHRPSASRCRQGRPKSSRSFWLELPVLLVIALGLAFLIKTFLMQAFYIPSGSMEETLAVGDRVLVNKLAYRFGDIERGDIVVFNGVDSWSPEVRIPTRRRTRSSAPCGRWPAPSGWPVQ